MKFDEIYKKHYLELKRFTFQLSVSEDDRADLLQDVFLKLYKEIQKGSNIENARAWLFKVLINHSNSFHKSTKQHENFKQTISIDVNIDFNVIHANKEKRKIVLEILNSMTKAEKEMLLLYDEGFSYSEIAEITGNNQNSIGKMLSRNIEKLKTKLKLQYNEMFD